MCLLVAYLKDEFIFSEMEAETVMVKLENKYYISIERVG